MKLFEFEGKEILGNYGILTPIGGVARNSEQAVQIAGGVEYPVMLKLQTQSGSRGKAGAIRPATSEQEVRDVADYLFGLGMGSSILVEQKADIAAELYISFSIQAESGSIILMTSACGGMEIEQIAREDSSKVSVQRIDIWRGLRPYQIRRALNNWGLTPEQYKQASNLASTLYKIFREKEAQLLEINPLVLKSDGNFSAVDAKVIIDDNALFRHPEFIKSTEERFTNNLEYQASLAGLNYVKLDGNIGLLCTGAGLTLATIDLIKKYGGEAANFLESGGSNYNNAYRGLGVVLGDPTVKVLFINTFGLVSRSDVICRGLADVLKELKPEIPIVASIRGTGEEIARKIFREELGIEPFGDTEEAVKKAVSMAGVM